MMKERGKNKLMCFSVLMSVYKNDNPEYLDSALKSIYDKQTLKPSEIIIVLDGPLTDELYRVIDQFLANKQEIVKVIKLEKNVGLGNALREGCKYCTYDYIMRMDSDDISVSNRFEVQIDYLNKHPEIDCLGGYIAEFYNSVDEDKRIREVPMKHGEIVKMSKHRNPMNHVTVCIKKEALYKCNGYEEINLLEDYYLWLKMIVNDCKLENMRQTLVNVRIGNGFNSKRGSKQRVEGWRSIQQYMLDNKLINNRTALINMLYIKAFVLMPDFLRKIMYTCFLRK